jgi:DNA-binding transcriptional ArsR family regulator
MKILAAVDALGALAHEHRLAAYRLLIQAGPDGLAAGLIADKLDLPPSSLTFHLQQLLRARLVSQRRESRNIFYAADFEQMNGLVAYLTQNCCGQASVALCVPGSRVAQSRKKSA